MVSVLASTATAGVLLAGCDPGAAGLGGGPGAAGAQAGPSGPADARVPAGTDEVVAARAALATLRVAAPEPADGYDRSCSPGKGCVFGPAWSDDTDAPDGHNGCGTRDDVLARDLDGPQLKPGSRCVVVGGVLHDRYTARDITFTKADADAVQIDHIVPLAAAWRDGARDWPLAKRAALANDPRNLVAVDGKANNAKSDKTADQWLPPNAAYHCAYAREIVTVKQLYGLIVTAPERDALRAALATCG